MISRTEANRIESREDFRRAASKRQMESAAEFSGFVGGALALGAFGSGGKGWIPAKIMNVDTDLILGGVTYLYSRRGRSKNHAMARGFSFSALAGGIRDLGASLSARF